MKASVVIPCYNEEDNINKLKAEFFPAVEKLIGAPVPDNGQIKSVEVIFIDDGSRDHTFDGLKNAFDSLNSKSMSVFFIKHEVNRGLGAALRTGFEAITGDIIITTDCDGTYPFSAIPTMLTYLKGDVAFVTASQYHPDGEIVNVPGYRIFLSRGCSFLYRILLNWRIQTYTSLFRAYRREVIDQISFDANGFLGGTELMVKAMLKGYKVAEFPTALHNRMFGVSKAKLIQTIVSHLVFQYYLLLHQLHIRSLFAESAP
jgi:dolichol-phosphate mannosyltransferase